MTGPRRTTVAEAVGRALAERGAPMFGVMGNGNAHVIDAFVHAGGDFVQTRHEAGSVGAADGFARASGRVGIATATYGAGYTNGVTPLAEAARAGTSMVFVVGGPPEAGLRPWDVDQRLASEALGVSTYRISREAPERTVDAAFDAAGQSGRTVVLEIPYDLATSAATPSLASEPQAPGREPAAAAAAAEHGVPREDALRAAAARLAAAHRPIVVAGRGALSAGVSAHLQQLADLLGAPTATTLLGQQAFSGSPWDLGIVGGLSTDAAHEIISRSDAVLVVGASLNAFTCRFGTAFGEAAVLRVDARPAPPSVDVELLLEGDAREIVPALIDEVRGQLAEGARRPWREDCMAGDGSEATRRAAGEGTLADGRLDPRSLMASLDAILPERRRLVQDIGHSFGWAPMYLRLAQGLPPIFMGTSMLSIGLGLLGAVGAGCAEPDVLTVAVMGDGSALMALADLDTLRRTSRSCLMVVVNDAAYSAEVIQYAEWQGMDDGPMLIEEVDFASVASSLGAPSVVATGVQDLDAVAEWVAQGARGLFVVDARVSRAVRADYMLEIAEHAKAADLGAEGA